MPAKPSGKRPPKGQKGKGKGQEDAAKEDSEDEATVLERKQAENAAKEKQLLLKAKELATEQKRIATQQADLAKRQSELASVETDLKGRESSVKQWQLERDEEFLASLEKADASAQELHTRRERYAILIGVNRYRDNRIADLDQSVERVRSIGVLLEQLNFRCIYLYDDLPDNQLPTRQNIEHHIRSLQREDAVVLIYFCGHAVFGHLTPPRSSPVMPFILPSNTPFEFATDTILTTDNLLSFACENTVDLNDNPFKRKALVVIDGCYIRAVTPGSVAEGFAALRSTTGFNFIAMYKRHHHCLLTPSLVKGLTGSVNSGGLISTNALSAYLHRKMVKRQLEVIEFSEGDPQQDFPLAAKLLRSDQERMEAKAASASEKCTFTLTFTVNQDLDVRHPLLQRIVAGRLIDCCGEGVEIGQMELVGKTDIVLEGVIQYAVKVEKQRLWRDAIRQFTLMPDIQFSLVSGESTRQGEEGRSAVIVLIETENEPTINLMRSNFAKMTHLFGHPCIDLRQHIRVTLISTEKQFKAFEKVATRGQIDDAIFTFTGLHKAVHRIERFNNVSVDKMATLVSDGVPIIIVSTPKGELTAKRNAALGRVADLEHFVGAIRFFFNDVLPDRSLAPGLGSLPGSSSIVASLSTSSVLLLDVKQGRNYVLQPGKSFFALGFFPDSDIRDFCESFLEGQLEALNHRTSSGNAHPKYRLL